MQKELDIAEYTDPTHNPMIPHTIVLEPGLVVHKIYNGYWYWGRPSPEDLRRDLRDVAPGLRDAWEAGERERFYPYAQQQSVVRVGA